MSPFPVLDSAEIFATDLSQLPDGQIPGWIVFVLEAIDSSSEACQFDELLNDLRLAIDSRLANGGW